MTPSSSSRPGRRRLQGVVVSTRMTKTAVIRIDHEVPHEKYGRYFTVSTKLKVHDEQAQAKVGDLIEIEETRPISADKCWRYLRTVKSAA